MKVALLNGSPHENGCTRRALQEIADEFQGLGVSSETIFVGNNMHPCIACRHCKDNKTDCIFKGDSLEYFINHVGEYNGIVVGSPVYYGGITSQLKNFLTRLFYSRPKLLEYMPCAGITVSRRSGNTSALAELNMFFLMHSMVVVGSQYWNECYGDFPNELQYDNEGLQTMRRLAFNMKYAMDCFSKVPKPTFSEKHIHTNFISREFLKLNAENTKKL